MKDFVHIAQNEWYDKHGDGDDRLRVSIWMPTAMPGGRLQTRAHGCNEPDTLPEGPAIAYINISGVSFGGYLDDLELLFDAVREELGNVRIQYENMLEIAAAKADES